MKKTFFDRSFLIKLWLLSNITDKAHASLWTEQWLERFETWCIYTEMDYDMVALLISDSC